MSAARKNRLPLILGAAAIVVAAIVAIVLVVTGGRSGSRDGGSTDRVKIELRAKPTATIRKDGRTLGKTPMTIVLPRSNKPITFDAVFEVQKVNFGKQREKLETFQQTKTVVPDAEQSVDFDVKDAALVEMTEQKVR